MNGGTLANQADIVQQQMGSVSNSTAVPSKLEIHRHTAGRHKGRAPRSPVHLGTKEDLVHYEHPVCNAQHASALGTSKGYMVRVCKREAR